MRGFLLFGNPNEVCPVALCVSFKYHLGMNGKC